jgi:hypothetical protein
VVAKGIFESGWKWSNNVKPIASTESCEVSHLGYCISGRVKVYADDGSEAEIGPVRGCKRGWGMRKVSSDESKNPDVKRSNLWHGRQFLFLISVAPRLLTVKARK